MMREGNMEYALTRVHARHGMRLAEGSWRRLEASRDLSHYLEVLRTSPQAHWIASLDPASDSHAMERALRNEWRRYVTGVAVWHPQLWQPWLAWLAWLPLLGLLAALARAAPAPRWLLADPVCGPLALGSPEERIAALQRTPFAALAPALQGRMSVAHAWYAQWQRLAPRSDEPTRQLRSRLLVTLERHAEAMLRTQDSSIALRQELTVRLSQLFRAGAETVVASVCHMALLALDLERLRGGLISRRVFGPRGERLEAT